MKLTKKQLRLVMCLFPDGAYAYAWSTELNVHNYHSKDNSDLYCPGIKADMARKLCKMGVLIRIKPKHPYVIYILEPSMRQDPDIIAAAIAAELEVSR